MTPTRLVCAVLLAAAGAGASAQQAPQQLPTVTLHANMFNVVAQLATTPEQREIGLMFRREMKSHEGMLFVFEVAEVQCFWMKNTLLPLSAAFVGDDGRIVNIADMKPLTLDSHCSDKPVRFVLEMNKGWFASHDIQPGFKLRGAPFAKTTGSP